MTNDAELLRRFVEENSDGAFRELVAQRINFVYAAALRQVGGDAHLAQEVAQSVFLDLARKARVLARRSGLAGWLYTSTWYAAMKVLRIRRRRMTHETEAHAMNETLAASSAADIDWNELRPVLDAAMHELGAADREAILLRYFEERSLAEVGAAVGSTENSARMRVDRALEKLRVRLARRGITSTAVALGAVLAKQPAAAAPSGLAASVAGFSLAGAAAGGGALAAAAFTLFEIMNTAKIIAFAAGLVGAAGIGIYWGSQHRSEATSAPRSPTARQELAVLTLNEENRQLRAELERLRANQATAGEPNSSASRPGSAVPLSPIDRLHVLTDLQNQKVMRPVITFVDKKGGVTDAFASLFALTGAERDVLQQTVDRAREKLTALERENANVTRDAKGNVVIKVMPFADAGGAIYDDLMASFAATLGQERNSAYLALGADQVEKALGNFGEPERTVVFSYNPGKSGEEQYVLRDEQKIPNPNGKGVSGSASTNDFRSFDDMVAQAGTISGLIPPDFHRGK